MASKNATRARPANTQKAPGETLHNPDTDKGVYPAAAPLGTDDEAGRVGPPPEPAKTYVVNTNGEVRAGPGDAGAQDAPRVLDDPRDKPQRGKGPLLILLIAGPALLLILWMFAG